MKVSNVTVRKRILVVLVIIASLYVGLVGRLGYIQLYQGNWLLMKADDLWSRDIPFQPKRGRILDRNGNVLAYNISAPTVMAIPSQIKDPETTARKLAAVLNMSEQKIYQLITKKESKVYLSPGGRKISDEKAKEVEALNLPGVLISEDSKRYYPYGDLAAHVLGFTGIDNQGLAGLELVYDEMLKGTPGAISYYADAKGEKMPDQPNRYIPPKDGVDLVTTLDLQIQSILEREMKNAMLQYQPEGIIGIVVNPKNGEVLAMASYPNFKPDEYQAVEPEIYNRNLPIWKMYEPGSTFKIITLAAAIEEGKVDLHKDHFYDPGYAIVAGAKIRCWKPGGHGSQSFLEVVENSCNPGFIELGQRLGKETLFQYIKDFGFGQKTGIDLRGEATGLLFKLNRVGPVELATTAFGQGVSVTPIQQVMAVSAAVNGGKLFTPQIGKKLIDPKTNEVIEERSAELKRTVISEETSKEVREALESVVARGTGYRAYVEEYRVGGKTGTAQKVGPNGKYLVNNHIVSFIGVAPTDDPQLVVYIAVDNPKGVQFGGVVAAPIVSKVIEESLRYLDVKPRQGGIPFDGKNRFDVPKYRTVPDLTGMTVTEIRNAHYGLPLDVTGEGNVVLDQAPEPGTRIRDGSKIRIYLGDKKEKSQ